MSLKGFRSALTPNSPPYREVYDGVRPNLGDDVRVYPGLPRLRAAQDQPFGLMDSYVVIEAGEPLAIVTINSKKWIVPASSTAYTLTYSALDIDEVEDIDSEGSLVAATGASSASVPAGLPIGVTPHAIRQNAKLTTGEMIYENFDTTDKEIVNRSRMFMIPYLRRGVNAIQPLKEGELIAVGSIYGNTLSATNRPRLVPADMTPTGTTAGTAGTIVITPTFANVAVGHSFKLKCEGVEVLFTVAAAAAVTSSTDIKFVKGINVAATIASLKAGIQASALNPLVVVTNDATTLTVTAVTSGASTALAYTEVEDTETGWAGAVTQGTEAAGLLHADGVVNALNLGLVIGRAVRVWATLPSNFDLSKAVTPSGSGVAGTETNGIPQDLYVRGNTTEGDRLPGAFSEAGALLIGFGV